MSLSVICRNRRTPISVTLVNRSTGVVMKLRSGRFLFILCCSFFAVSHSGYAQLGVSTLLSPEELVKKVLVRGGATIQNVKYTGAKYAIGSFTSVGTLPGISEGIVLTTGSIQNAPGPNINGSKSTDNFLAGEPDLQNETGGIIYDACVLEFDFIPYGDSVSFQYAFASEEYLEFVGSPYNDVFAFYISGPGISGIQNIALIPGTASYVSINNVNHLTNQQYFIDNFNGPDIEYDGITAIFTATAKVEPCGVYHLKLAIADVSDGIYDSAVFLKAGSFQTGSAAIVQPFQDPVEKCKTGGFTVSRVGPIDKPLNITYTVKGSATAGIDYSQLAGQLTLAPGDNSVFIPVEALEDQVFDPDETIMIVIAVPIVCGFVYDSASITIREFKGSGIIFDGETHICRGSPVTIEAKLPHFNGIPSYSWEPGGCRTKVLTDTPTVSTMYVLTIQDQESGCSFNDSVYVTLHDVFLSVIDTVTTCAGKSTSVTAYPSGGKPPYSFQWNPSNGLSSSTVPDPQIYPVVSQYYYVVVTDAMGCKAVDSVYLNVAKLEITAGNDLVICPGASVQGGVTVLNGAPPYTYVWSPVNGINNIQSQTPVFSPSESTMYYITVTDESGCTATDSVLVRVSELQIVLPGDTTVCHNGSVRVSASAKNGAPPFTYRWHPETGISNPHSQSPIIAPDTSTRYTVTITDAIGCTSSGTIEISVLPQLALTVTNDTLVCRGSALTLRVSAMGGKPPYTYHWSPEAGLNDPGSSNPSFVATSRQTYIVQVLDAFGCVAQDSVDVFTGRQTSVNAGRDTAICFGHSVRLNPLVAGTFRPYRYRWDPPYSLDNPSVLTPLATPAAATEYILTVTDSLGCEFADTVTVDVHVPEPFFLQPEGKTVFCTGDSVRLSAPVGFTGYFWSTGDKTQSIVVRHSGMYSCFAANAEGCIAPSDTVMVTVHTPPEFQIAGQSIVCENAVAEYAYDPPNPDFDPVWSVTGGTILSQQANRVQVQWGGSVSAAVSLTMVDKATGCSASMDYPVTVGKSIVPALVLDGDSIRCEGDTVTLRTTIPYQSYRWSTGATTPTITMTASGTYSVTVEDEYGCAGTSAPLTMTFVSVPVPVITLIGSAILCPGDSVILVAPPGYSRYLWSTGDTTERITTRATGEYSVTVTNDIGCTATSGKETIFTSFTGKPSVALNGRPALCEGDTVELIAESGYAAYRWSTGETAARITVTTAGIYSVEVTNQSGCHNVSDPVEITVAPVPAPEIAGTADVCVGSRERYGIQPANGTTLLWSAEHGSVMSGNGTASIEVEWREAGAGSVRVIETTPEGCEGTSYFPVEIHALPVVSIVRRGDTLDAGSWSAYQWYLEDAPIMDAVQRFFVTREPGMYSVRVEDTFGCTGLSGQVVITGALTSTVSLPHLRVRAGDRVRIPLVLSSSNGPLHEIASEFTGELKLNATVLAPAGATPSGRVEDGYRFVPFTATLAQGRDTLASLEFIAMLGTTDYTGLTLAGYAWDNPDVATALSNGSVTVIVCEEGGKRLFDDTGALRLEQNNPNPYNASTEIEFELIETGYTTLVVYDLLGREAAALVRETLKPGTYRIVFDASALASGTYIYALQTPTARLVKSMRVLK